MLLSVSLGILLMLKEILLVLAGAISAIFGGFLATWYQAKKARKIRREEVIGEKQVEVYQQAAMRISTLKSLPDQISLEEARKFVYEQEDWFWENHIFLPPKFRNKWLSLRSHLKKALRRENLIQKQTEPDDKTIKELEKLESGIEKMVQEAENIILQELNLPEIEIERILFKEPSDQATKS